MTACSDGTESTVQWRLGRGMRSTHQWITLKRSSWAQPGQMTSMSCLPLLLLEIAVAVLPAVVQCAICAASWAALSVYIPWHSGPIRWHAFVGVRHRALGERTGSDGPSRLVARAVGARQARRARRNVRGGFERPARMRAFAAQLPLDQVKDG